MVGDAPDAIAFAVGVAGYGRKVGVEVIPHRKIEERLTIPSAKDDVDEEERKRLWHREDFRSGLQPSWCRGA